MVVVVNCVLYSQKRLFLILILILILIGIEFLKRTRKIDKNLKVCVMLKVRHNKKNTLYIYIYINRQ